ncbi:hypothetical protein GXW83_00925 [Streptacidiphilus sp. PB12-B1b]|uniref:hypothetical protein n=1 Tax=Streptacidiphilus sp. PB12-B1b TaxID=2705012 RepID=UPI0015FB2A67|nr:hypothetical protein [Streptacidiphilus sp. PB12-B1b]QMU74559.1 hypothetical protein GXW83_00925 [Streptacidiphilus sp. PB12-B1b]
MRLRNTLAAAVGAAVLVMTLPTSADAAGGEFRYTFHGHAGELRLGRIVDPPSRECITLPEVADEDELPADSPRNDTDATATVFSGADCTGEWFSLRPYGGHASERLKLRSVVFS